MESLWSNVTSLITADTLLRIFYAVLKVAIGLLAARLISNGVVKMFARQASVHHALILRRITFYVILGLFVASALTDLDVDLSVFLGAAGILTVAIGFASQTSASNVISGLFLIGEKPFAIGDVIKIGTTTGEVLSIDLLSAKIRTFDNLYVRVPNETIIKSEITNLTRFPIRRIDIVMGVAYKEDLNRVRDVLMETADRHPLCLDEPRPLFIVHGFGESSMNFQFSIWAMRENFLVVKNEMLYQIKQAFDREGIEIPFPHRALLTASQADPLPIRLIQPA